jgi:DNA-binding PadR family transcriptional regulator
MRRLHPTSPQCNYLMIAAMSSVSEQVQSDLSLGEWAVLGLLVASPAHGFALAKELTAGGRWGRIWTVPRPLVYRAMNTLEGSGLISMDRAEESKLGPRRAVYQATTSGKSEFSDWLSKPVVHYRDARSQLLLKLGFLWLRGESAEPLLSAQLAAVEPMLEGLREKLAVAEGFDRTLALWRFESAQALVRFVEGLTKENAQAGRPSSIKRGRRRPRKP